jgi:hypothetical protein
LAKRSNCRCAVTHMALLTLFTSKQRNARARHSSCARGEVTAPRGEYFEMKDEPHARILRERLWFLVGELLPEHPPCFCSVLTRTAFRASFCEIAG